MNRRVTNPLAASWVLGLVLLSAAARRSGAQDPVPVPLPPCGHPGHHHEWCLFQPRPVFPRTFSYQYDIWFNRPRHTRYIAPDGQVRLAVDRPRPPPRHALAFVLRNGFRDDGLPTRPA